MKFTKSIIAVTVAAASLCSCKVIKDCPAPTKAAADSVSYIAGIQGGSFLRGNGICENADEVNFNRIKDGIKAVETAKGEFNSEEFNANFEISPEYFDTVFPEYLASRRDSAFVASAGQIDTVSYLCGLQFGAMLRFNMGLDEYKDINMGEFREGMDAFFGLSMEDLYNQAALDSLLKIKPADFGRAIQGYALAKEKHKGAEFINKQARKFGVKHTKSGLTYKIINKGNNVKPTAEDQVSVFYEGTLIDGTKFDGNMENEEPITFRLDGVIKGWTEGLQLIGEGGEIELYIPSDLAYGDRGAGYQIKGGAALVFKVKLVSVIKAEEPAAEEPAAEAEVVEVTETVEL